MCRHRCRAGWPQCQPVCSCVGTAVLPVSRCHMVGTARLRAWYLAWNADRKNHPALNLPAACIDLTGPATWAPAALPCGSSWCLTGTGGQLHSHGWANTSARRPVWTIPIHRINSCAGWRMTCWTTCRTWQGRATWTRCGPGGWRCCR